MGCQICSTRGGDSGEYEYQRKFMELGINKDRFPKYQINFSQEDGQTAESSFKVTIKEPMPSCETPDDVKTVLYDGIAKMGPKGFETLDCSGNSYSLEAAQYLAKFIRLFATDGLRSVDYSNMFVSRSIEDIPKSLEALLSAINGKPVLSLGLHDNAIGVRVVKQGGIDTFLQSNRALKKLNLSNCGLSGEAMQMLFVEQLSNSGIKLTELKISMNNFKSAGAIAMAEYLENDDDLQVLEMSGCRVEQDGMTALFKALKVNAYMSLKHLDVNDNNAASEEATDALLALVKYAGFLDNLIISDLAISEEELQTKIVDAFKQFKSINKLNWDYDIDPESEIGLELAKILADLGNIKEVSLLGCIGSKTKRDEIRELYKSKNKVIFLTDNDKASEEGSASESD